MTTAKEILFSLEKRLISDKVDADLNIIFHFDLSGDDGGEYTVEIKNKTCSVSEGFSGEAKCKVTAKAKDYVAVETGKTNAQMAFMMGKIKVTNLNAMFKFIETFERIV